MPFLKRLGENEHQYSSSQSSHPRQTSVSTYDNRSDKEIIALDGEFYSYTMNQSLTRPKSPFLPPLLPPRNAKRMMARIVEDTLGLRVAPIKNKVLSNASLPRKSDPHEVYISSEEDISNSECNEEFLFDSEDSGDSQSEFSDLEFQLDTAEAVSIHRMGKPRLIKINSSSKVISTLPSISSLDRPHRTSLSSLLALRFSLSDYKVSDQDLFSSIRPLSVRKIANNNSTSNVSLPENLYKASPMIEKPAPTSEASTSLSLFRSASLARTRSQIRQSLLHIPLHTTNISSGNNTGLSGRMATLKRVSNNIRHPKISLAYTPGVVTRRPFNHRFKGSSIASEVKCP